jgi:predicted transcriptional regulator
MTTKDLTLKNSPVSLRLDPKVKNKLQKQADLTDRSLSYVAQQAIIEFLETKERERQIVEQALLEADKGKFISDEKMMGWIESWGSENELPEPEADLFLK